MTERRNEPKKLTQTQVVDMWTAADNAAVTLSELLRSQNVRHCRENALALMLLSANECHVSGVVDEKTFLILARDAYRISALARFDPKERDKGRS